MVGLTMLSLGEKKVTVPGGGQRWFLRRSGAQFLGWSRVMRRSRMGTQKANVCDIEQNKVIN